MSLKDIDVLDVGDGQYVLISENRINFVSEIKEGSLRDVLCEESDLIEFQEFEPEEVFMNPSIAFMPTLDCNLRCIYCYARGGDDKVYMDSALARMAIDNLAKSRKNYSQETLSIYFVGGGEPFLNFGCMKDVCQYAKEKFAGIEIIIVSNGTFGKKQLDWLIENNVAIRISFDGLFHEDQRPFVSGKSSRKLVEGNIRKLVKSDAVITVQLTITNESVTAMPKSVEYITSLGVKYIKIEPVHYSIFTRGEKNLVPELKKYVENFITTVNLILNKGLEVKIDNSIISRPTSGYYCGAGGGSNKTITPSGDITACLEVSRPGEKYSDVMMYGKCFPRGFAINTSKRVFLDKLHFSNYEKCGSCNLKLICGGGCPIQGGWDNDNLLIPSEYNCSLHKLLLPELFKMAFYNNRLLDIIFDNHIIEVGC